MTRVALFGASGYLGAQVLRRLCQDPRVTSVTCFGRDRHDLVHGSVADLAALLREAQPDAVANCTGRLAGQAHELTLANTVATAKLLDAIAVAAPGARFVRLGSAAEYGPVPPDRAVTERDLAQPLSEYGLTHLAATRLVELASAAGRADGAVLRVFNPVGPGLAEDTVLGRVAAALRRAVDRGGDITVGPLDAYRDFVDVRDVASAVLAAVLVPHLPERVFNVGSGQAVPVRHAVRLLADVAGFAGQIREDGGGSGRSAAVGWIRADIGRAWRGLGWTPVHDLTESVKTLWQACSASATAVDRGGALT